MTGADLENLANEAALVAMRRNKDKIYMEDFEEAKDISLMGTVKEMTISDEEKRSLHTMRQAMHWLPGDCQALIRSTR